MMNKMTIRTVTFWLATRRVTTGLTVVLACGGGANVYGQVSFDTRDVVETLASDEMEGRLTGTDGTRRAADEIIRRLTAIGAVPLPGLDGYTLPFGFTAGVTDGGTRLTATSGDGLEGKNWATDEVRALSFTEAGSVSGPLVFAGYGLTVPETDGFSYDSYATLDVQDKIVLVLNYFPEDTEGELRGTLARYSGLRYKAMAARERGAAGVLVVTGPRSPNAGSLVAMTFDNAISGSGIHAASVTGEVAAALVAATGRSLSDVQSDFDTGNPHVTGFDLEVDVTLEARVERERRTGYNVAAMLPATVTSEVDKPFVILGAHYDHLGRGRGGGSLARGDEAGQIHNGADDNASGVAAILSAGTALAEISRTRTVVLAFWSGEELGLLGSADFVESSPIPMDDVAAYLNFDMVGRLTNNTLSVQAVGTSPVWTPLVEELNQSLSLGFNLQFVSDPYLPTDVGSFNTVDVPSLAFFTGSHDDYHRPTDDAETLDYDGLDRIAALGQAVAAHLVTDADAPPFVKVERAATQGVQTVMRIFTGTIPDYTEGADGLLLSGVVGGGPAEAAGLQGGDVIVELAGHSIANIYDYTYALDLLRVDQPAPVVFMRGDVRHETEIVPEARQ
jgi:hypothetical protein